ncbi:MAG: putative metal-binding motif-containing protein [Patescibacteria group bacterium]
MTLFVLSLLSCTVQETTNPTTHVRGNTEYVSVDPSTYYPDADGDGFGDPNGASVVATSVSTGYANNADDCNDENKRINPGQPEVCDLVDNNCDGSVDNAATDEHVWFIDGDGDGYGESSATTTNCDPYAPSRFSAVSTDCNDFRADMYPGAVEYCNDVDDNCDDVIDEDGAADGTVWYADADGDGRGSNADDAVTVVSCDKPKGYVNGHTDCDDTNAEVRTGAVELCDGVDNDCDGEVDNDASDGTAYYLDTDLDGYGDMYGWYGPSVKSCDGAPSGYVDNSLDCDDGWNEVNPDAAEQCNEYDDNCDGSVDEGVATFIWYVDFDEDGYGDATQPTTESCSMWWGYAIRADDCDDTDPMMSPGMDADLDGESVCTDCDDHDDDNYPGATEVADGEDNDCDGSVDEE